MASAEPTPTPPATVTPPSTKPTPLLSTPTTTTPSAPTSVSEAAATSSSSPVTPSVAAPSDADLVHIPSYSRWFSFDDIHECEVRFLPEFFDSRSPSKTPKQYIYLRNSIVKQFRRNPSSKLAFTDVRKTLLSDVGSIRRVFDFCDAWGLINYSPPSLAKQLKWEDRDSKSSGGTDSRAMASSTSDTAAAPLVKESSKRVCSACMSLCSIACFTCDKYDITLCARCFVRGHYRVGVISADFRRVEISDETHADWTDKETLRLLEAVTHYGDDWKKVAQHLSGRSEKDCITHFIKLPMGEQLACFADGGGVGIKQYQSKDDNNAGSGVEHNASKRLCLSPLADASNPIMAQSAFLSALAGSRVAEAAAQAALAAVSKAGQGESKAKIRIIHKGTQVNSKSSEEDHQSDVKPMQKETEKVKVDEEFCRAAEVQTKEIVEKVIWFEEKDKQIEKEWKQMEQVKDMLFFDQLNYLRPKTSSGGDEQTQAQGDTKLGFT
ncbi:SWI/SNF complex subunit SWI3B [Linum grandiflorum]